MSGATPADVRRLILDLGQGAADPLALQMAAELAGWLGVDLHGLFIEDEAVLALADLPFARELRLPTHEWSPLDAAGLAAELRHAAEEARRTLTRILAATRVPGGFEVRRGDPAACLAEISGAGDLVLLALSGSVSARPPPDAARTRAAMARGAASALLVLPARPRRRRGPVVVVPEGAADPALEIAARIAAATHEPLTILLRDPGPQAGAAVRDRAAGFGVPRQRVAVAGLAPAGTGAIQGVPAAPPGQNESLIVLGRAATGDGVEAAQLAAAHGVPVLLVEAPPAAEGAPAGSPAPA